MKDINEMDEDEMVEYVADHLFHAMLVDGQQMFAAHVRHWLNQVRQRDRIQRLGVVVPAAHADDGLDSSCGP